MARNRIDTGWLRERYPRMTDIDQLLDDANKMMRGLFHDFGGELGGELRRRGWTQRELADRSGVSRSTVSNVVQGRSVPNMATASEIFKALEGR